MITLNYLFYPWLLYSTSYLSFFFCFLSFMHFLFIILFICSMFYFSIFYFFLNLIKCFKPEIFKSICNNFKSYQCIWFCTLLLHFGTCAYLFSPEEGSCYIFSTRNNCCEFLAYYGVIQSFAVEVTSCLLKAFALRV